ncbi:MAG: molybdopterin-dependent oxidoreductase [Caldimicrobium sp.]
MLEACKVSRRQFLKTAGAVSALAAVSDLFNFSEAISKELLSKVPYAPKEDVLIPSTDVMCVNFCGIRVRRVNGVVRAIYGNPENPQNKGHLCPKGIYGIFHTYNPYRVKKPLKRTNPDKDPAADPRWMEISYEEALDEIIKRLKKIKAEDPRKLIWEHAHGKYLIGDQFPKAFAKAFGTPNVVHRTTACEAARHVADEITWGYHGILPDVDHCDLLLLMGANPFEADQWARWLDRKIITNKERGLKLIVVEPRLSNAGAKAHEWIPIRPGKDVVFLLAMANELIKHGYVDKEFLVTYTNAPFLVGPDGKFVRKDGKPLIWDTKTNSAKPYEGDVAPALEGHYQVDGISCKTAFEVFKETIKEVTPEVAAEICGVPAETIRRIALEFGKKARIGDTITIEGKKYRYRPVAIYTFRGVITHEYGVQAWRAAHLVMMLVGAQDAVGGLHLHDAGKKMKYLEPSKAEYPPSRVDLQESIYFPHATHNVCQQVALTLLNPKAYGLPYEPEMLISYATNRPMSVPGAKKIFEGYKKIFHVSIAVELTEFSNMADIVLPDKTHLEVWHWSPTRWNLEAKHIAIRQPIVNVYNLPYDAYDYLMIFAERLGILDKYIEEINKAWKIKLKPGRRYSAEEFIAAMAEANHTTLEYLKTHGLKVKKLKPEAIYLKGVEAKFKGPGKPKLNFYAENLVITAERIKEKVEKYGVKNLGIDNFEIVFSPLPRKEHAFHTAHVVAKDYPFYLCTYKRMYFNQTMHATNPLLREIAHDADENFVLINTETAKRLGINEGDYVWVESPEGKLKIKAKLTEGIRPDVVGISYHYGHISSGLPDYAKKGANPNFIMMLYPDRISGHGNFNDTKVKIYKA